MLAFCFIMVYRIGLKENNLEVEMHTTELT